AALRNHRSRSELARMVVRANARAEHGVPAPERLLPEWPAPGEFAVVDHALVAAPDTVHQDVDRIGVSRDARECRFDLTVVPMVAADAGDVIIEGLVLRRRPSRGEDPRAGSSELGCDAAAHASGGAGDDCDFPVQSHAHHSARRAITGSTR